MDGQRVCDAELACNVDVIHEHVSINGIVGIFPGVFQKVNT